MGFNHNLFFFHIILFGGSEKSLPFFVSIHKYII